MNCSVSIGSLLFRSGLLFLQLSIFLVTDREYYCEVLIVLLVTSLLFRVFKLILVLTALRYVFWDFLIMVLVVLHAASFFSNSFVVFESTASRFLMQSALLIAFLQTLPERFACFFVVFFQSNIHFSRFLNTFEK